MMAAMGLTPLSYGVTSALLSAGVDIQTIMLLGAVPLLSISVLVLARVPAIVNEQ
ncbi:hypothetical protein GJU40_15525 [Bacillus lacus]|uniref:Uncharacterized protein n=1 Tax=Metabacillus lacus TaxID=1983721 RepID=A0A7X2J1F3_9BACI|nr:hypothetical protein [Metabacillus lacus]MRX73554.1 hypothetical protein [Metabacillus lacus]